jgi:ATPase family associated with various cellular activities (AAA)
VAAENLLNPLELAPPSALEFEDLDALRVYLDRTLAGSSRSLHHYYDEGSGGFFHKIEPGDRPDVGDYSKASTSTCLRYLAEAGLLGPPLSETNLAAEARRRERPWTERLGDLRDEILSAENEWRSAGLDADNPFTVAFLLEAVWLLTRELEPLEGDQEALVGEKLAVLLAHVMNDDGDNVAGSVRIAEYPPTAYLTQLAVRVLKTWDALPADAARAVEGWAWSNLRAESVVVATASTDADVFELAYSVLTASAVSKFENMTPQERLVLTYALDQFFAAQDRKTGSWPRSRPLFLYPTIGYAYCFDCELLAELMRDEQLEPLVFDKLELLRLAAYQLDRRKYPLQTDAYGWSSGHHGQRRFAESWSTASVFQFAFELQRYVAEAIRRVVFLSAGGTYTRSTRASPSDAPELPDTFLDSRVKAGVPSLKTIIETKFLKPLLESRRHVEQGRPLPRETPIAAIFYGAPGTSKTELARLIAKTLGWPFLALDPSHLTREGLDKVHAEAHRLFGMLQSCERIVVLLDEFDELVRERERADEIESRFLTTAMLPKLSALSSQRRLVYIIATNHIERFDLAIRRPGRFDMIVPVNPPTVDEKCRFWPNLQEKLEEQAAENAEHASALREKIDLLTYLECDALQRRLELTSTLADFTRLVEEAGDSATLDQPVDPPAGDTKGTEKWKERIEKEARRILIPGG